MDARALVARYRAALVAANNNLDERDKCLADVERTEREMGMIK